MKRWTVSLLALSLTGCFAVGDMAGLKGKMNVFGVEMNSSKDYREINGVAGADEPCLRGYERRFDALDLSIGYGFDGKIRKITTSAPNTSILGISPGMPAADGAGILLREGLSDTKRPFQYRGDGFFLTLLVDGSGKIFGVTIERVD